jgi:3-(3-hydroxy-phenyl)propionate hydroxylase
MSGYYQPKKYPASQVASTPEDAAALPVVIAGAGPVGMAVALGLVHRGIPVTVLESADQVSFGSRAICLSRHSLEIADRLGFGERLEAIALPWVGGRSFYQDRQVLQFEMPYAEHAVRPPMVNVSQSELEQLMVDELLNHPLATLHWRAEVSDCTQATREDGGEEVRLEVHTAEGPRTLRARWVVAADGGRSKVRSMLDLRLDGNSYEGSYVIADIHWPSGLPTERMVWFDAPSNPASTIIMHRQPNDIWRIDYQLDATDDPEFETTEERIRDRITRHLAWLKHDTPWTLEWHGFYRAHALALDRFDHGNVLFAGDAAHLVPIFGVRGLNSGLEDAETLAWQLAAVLSGSAERELLSAYSAERRAAWQQNVDNAAKSTLMMSPGGHGFRTTRDAVLSLAAEDDPDFSALVNPRQSSATHAHGSPLTWPVEPGTTGTLPGAPVEDRSVQRLTGSGPVPSSLGAVRGRGFTLLGFGLSASQTDALVDRAGQLANALNDAVRAVVVAETAHSRATTLADDGVLSAALGARPGEVFVIRPDGLLLARTTDHAQLAALADHLRAGTAPSGTRAEATTTTASEPEQIWLALSEALQEADESDREGMLTRLALLLGRQSGAHAFTEALTHAVKTAPIRSSDPLHAA